MDDRNMEGKDLGEMDNRELFLVLTGERGVVLQARLQNIVREYLAHTETHHLEDGVNLKTVVQQYVSGSWNENKND